MSHEDLKWHITNFLDVCETFNQTGVTNDAICLTLFSFFLRDKAKMWLNFLALGTITTWEEWVKKFLAKFFPVAKIAKLQSDIMTFSQWENESLYRPWECFKELLRKCPLHDLTNWLHIQTLYNVLGTTNSSIIYATINGAFMRRALEVAYALLEELSSNNYQWSLERTRPKPATGMLELDHISIKASP